MTADYEQLLEQFYRTLLRPGDVAIDAGAHTGRHTVPIAQLIAPGGKVFAFEPLPFARAELERVTARDVGVVVQPFALSDQEGEDEFVVAVDMPGYSGLKTRTYDGQTRVERISVNVRTLDGLFAHANRLNYVKIDAEGGELGILRGSTALLERFAPVVTFEFGANSLGSYGITVEDMAEFWRDKKYLLYDILGRPLDLQRFAASAHTQEVWDYVALPEPRAAQVVAAWRAAQR